jgi:hypothetical protein
VNGSFPRFCIGIYGDKGAGKTALMNSILKKLQANNPDVLTVWLNAWKDSNEDERAAFSFLRTIGLALENVQDKQQSKWSAVRRGVERTAQALIDSTKLTVDAGEVQTSLSKMIDMYKSDGTVMADGSREFVYRNALGFLERAMYDIRAINRDFKIIVFIDDIDRCIPKKVLEFLELRRLFDLEGFIFILGLNAKKVTKLIEMVYGKEFGESGHQYLQELVQVPVTLPGYTISDVTQIILNLAEELDTKYAEFIRGNVKFIAEVAGTTPADIIRFINSFIVAQESYPVYSSSHARALLVMQSINMNWNKFYQDLVSRRDFRTLAKGFINKPEAERKKSFDDLETRYYQANAPEILMLNYKTDSSLWSFLFKHRDILLTIDENSWSMYRGSPIGIAI